jgi:hypothetical protein
MYILTICVKIKLQNLSLLQLPTIMSTAKIPSKESAGKIVYLIPLKNTTFCIAWVFLSE